MALPAAAAVALRTIGTAAAAGAASGGGDDGGGIKKGLETIYKNAQRANSALDRMRFNFSSLNIPLNPIKAGMDLALTLDKLNVKLGQTTGFTSHLTQDFIQLAVDASTLGLSFNENVQLVGELSTGLRTFNIMNSNTRRAITKTTAQFYKLGVDARTAAKTFDLFISSMGKTPMAAQKSIEAMHLLAQQVGRSTADVTREFTQFAPQLLKYGDNVEGMFARLQKTSRAYHLDVAETIAIADQFDTFEGAAEKVGKLNSVFAQYNLNLNDAVVRELEEGERIEYIASQFKEAGIQIDGMGKRMRQIVAGQLFQGNQDLMSRFFADPERFEDFQKQQQTMAETSQKFTDSISRLQGQIQRFFVESGVIEYGTQLLKELANAFDNLPKDAGFLDYLFKAGSIALTIAKRPLKSDNPLFGGESGRGSGALAEALALDPTSPEMIARRKQNERDATTVKAAVALAKRASGGGTISQIINAPERTDDLYIPGANRRGRYVVGPEGTFSLNNKDSILAGTNLGGGMSASDIQKAVQAGVTAAMSRNNRPVEVTLDGRILGRAMMDELNKQMSPITPV